MAHHAAAKAALDNYGKALAAGLAPAGIRVTVIMPGNVLTPGADEVRQSFDDAMGVELAAVTADIPPGRPGDPRGIAEAVAHLVPDRAQWITGASLNVEGGELPAIQGLSFGSGRLGGAVRLRPTRAGSGACGCKAEEGARAEPRQPTTTPHRRVPDPASPE
ncbi:hypothetical protein QFZ63_007131 [Streptomyces sp. B3I7]|nr:hypothetical protein [Streptomyces sp. B3I7]MDQ0815417.1 hypothetical protein [Streptomyces sp. B3I7]